jgi:hypothetical protein
VRGHPWVTRSGTLVQVNLICLVKYRVAVGTCKSGFQARGLGTPAFARASGEQTTSDAGPLCQQEKTKGFLAGAGLLGSLA